LSTLDLSVINGPTLCAMPLILSVETATLGGSVCITRGATVLACNTGEPRLSHSNTLLTDISNALVESKSTLGEISLFAVACGPGSFTGLRIGIATVKALAATMEKPCAGIPSLQAVARAAGASECTVALLPAGRGEVFAQMFSISPQGLVAELDSIAHISPERMLERYDGVANIRWCGEGAHVYAESIRHWAERAGHEFGMASGDVQVDAADGWWIAPKEPNLARHVGALALIKFDQNQLDSPSDLRAIYVRPSDAELKAQCQHPNEQPARL
jgi:tRNA threonylcarbamoyladenosine biosynthesis protein TsaB